LQREKLMKLRSPNFAVSLTRLAVHNVPREIDEKQLKQVFVDAVKARAKKQKPHVKQVKVLRETDRVGPDGKPRSKGAAFIEFSEHQHAVAALRALNNHPSECSAVQCDAVHEAEAGHVHSPTPSSVSVPHFCSPPSSMPHPYILSAIFSRDARPIVEFAIENVSIVKQRQHTVRQQSDRRQAVRQQQKQEKRQHQKQEAGAAGLGKASGAKRKPEEGEALAVGDAQGSPSKKKQKQVKGGKGQGQQEKRQGAQQESHGKGPGKDMKGRAGAEVQAGTAAEQQSVGVKAVGGAERGGARGSGKGELKRKQKGSAGSAGVSPAAAVKSVAVSPPAAMKAAAAAVSPGAKKAKTDPQRGKAAVAMKAVAVSPSAAVIPGSKRAKTDTRRGEAAAAVMEARRAQAALAGLGRGGGEERGKVRSKKGSEHQELVDELDRLVAAYRSKNYG
ncbi:unnamed protein product, partial [Closterium sp. NIES-53]